MPLWCRLLAVLKSRKEAPEADGSSEKRRGSTQIDSDASGIKQGNKYCFGYKGHIEAEQGLSPYRWVRVY